MIISSCQGGRWPCRLAGPTVGPQRTTRASGDASEIQVEPEVIFLMKVEIMSWAPVNFELGLSLDASYIWQA